MNKIVVIGAMVLSLAACGGYDTRPIKGEEDCFQIQEKGDDYIGLGTYCKVELDK